MDDTVAILALTIMALGLIAVIFGLTQFVKMFAPSEHPAGGTSAKTQQPDIALPQKN